MNGLRRIVCLLACSLAFSTPCGAQAAAPVFPGTDWRHIAQPETAGYSPQKLAMLRNYLSSLDTTALMVVTGGHVLFEYGDPAHVSVLASARKSVLAMLYGKYIHDGTIKLDRTLADIGFDDIKGLSATEKQATVEHLLTARSGIYHPAANSGDDTAHAPERGSVAPGTKHLYNNWDFNAAGAVFEQLAKRDIYDAFGTDLAQPLGMQDFDRARQRKTGNRARSQHLAYHLHLSTRDMARLGLLMLREGRWQDTQVMPAGWSARITRVITPYDELIPERRRRLGAGERWGYGHMWWTWDTPAADPSDVMAGAYTARGLGGQYITVIPRLDMVIAHKVDPRPDGDRTQPRRRITATQYGVIIRMITGARCPSASCK
ncbi:MAG: serine hydrolase domain-containing protein [Burkholderiales bacterium]